MVILFSCLDMMTTWQVLDKTRVFFDVGKKNRLWAVGKKETKLYNWYADWCTYITVDILTIYCIVYEMYVMLGGCSIYILYIYI